MTSAEFLWALSCRLPLFCRKTQHYPGYKVYQATTTVNHRAHWHPEEDAPHLPQNLHPCRGLALVGRCGPETGRWGEKVDGKIRHFRNDDCAFLEREARLMRGPAKTIGEVGHRAAARPSIYVGFAAPAFGSVNIIQDVGRRIAVRPSIYVGFAPSA